MFFSGVNDLSGEQHRPMVTRYGQAEPQNDCVRDFHVEFSGSNSRYRRRRLGVDDVEKVSTTLCYEC